MIDTCIALVAVVLHLAADEKAGLMLLKANEKGKAWSMGLHWTLFCVTSFNIHLYVYITYV